ncbi:adenine-specific DNA-methyltransferase [Sunxiuqinia elliptica]|uniref:Methyltransferase n=1 Tax=Sunxiuqinia elliptica TaxID=655355 RepID=A0A1I2EZQ4_9BACT|nr:adenine-specific DNA-methyltransferase [Sunxiuqinia elliptica]SFE98592.1 site-specific DNA-methyltransferase (adenine-specific) [Sunxiuqinia elliptica]
MAKYTESDHTIYHGDSIEILTNEIPNESIDLIFIDPPYNIGKNFNGLKDKWKTDGDYIDWCYKWIDLCLAKLKPSGSLYIMTSTQFMPYYDIYLRDKITILSRIIWSYDSSGVQAKNFYGSMYEPILYCVKDKANYTFNSEDIQVEAKTGSKRKLIDYRKNPPQPYKTTKTPGNVWEFARVRYRMEEYEKHPTQKPIALLERIIKASTNKNDVVLDPFSGTFTTSFMAKKLGRKSIGIEINEDYVKIGLRRVLELDSINGEKLAREAKSYEIKNKQTNTLF